MLQTDTTPSTRDARTRTGLSSSHACRLHVSSCSGELACVQWLQSLPTRISGLRASACIAANLLYTHPQYRNALFKLQWVGTCSCQVAGWLQHGRMGAWAQAGQAGRRAQACWPSGAPGAGGTLRCTMREASHKPATMMPTFPSSPYYVLMRRNRACLALQSLPACVLARQ